MNKVLLKAAIVGGIIAFVWSIFSWGVIGWPKYIFQSFTNEEKVAEVIQSHAQVDGIYLLPNPYEKEGMNSKASKQNIFSKGPIVYATVVKHGLGDMRVSLVFSFISQLFTAYIIGWIVIRTKGNQYWPKVFYVTLIGGVVVSLLGIFPSYLWKGDSGLYVIISMVDYTIAWLLAGLAMIKIIGLTLNYKK
ncbi:MAG: hypothetical protein EBZ47_04570 [Chlamydiae bacterium]|nr:hypothetical protein [Chlamydiota bacterium]